jgi:hypothetical protein
MSLIYYRVSHVNGMASCSVKSGPSGFKKRKYGPVCDVEEAISNKVDEELDIDSDDKLHLDIEGETASEQLSNKRPESKNET